MGALPPNDLINFLKLHPEISDATLEVFRSQEVLKKDFHDLSEDEIRISFPTITFGQRKALVAIIQAPPLGSNEHREDTNGHREDTNVSNNLNVLSVSQAVLGVAQSAPKRKKKAAKKKEINYDDIEPLDIKSILEEKKSGRDVIETIKETKFLNKQNQETMMDMVHSRVLVGDSPHKYYPSKVTKLSVAKGIITDFPELRDPDEEKPYETWYKKFENKCQTVRVKLPSGKKRPRVANLPTSSSTTQSLTQPVPSNSTAECGSSQPTASTLCETLVSWMHAALPTTENKREISVAMQNTFQERRTWIEKNSPSCTEVLMKYRHLMSFKGEMVSEEFQRMKPGSASLSFEEVFSKEAPYIWTHYVRQQKSETHINELEVEFNDINIRALVVLPKLLQSTLTIKTVNAVQLEHIKRKKFLLEKIPSSALLQIVPENTDIESYVSVEFTDEVLPVFPFLLWATNDKKSGEIYLKLDKKSIYVASFEDPGVPLLKAIACLLEAAYVFNLEYHPYLRHVFQFIEHLVGIGKPKLMNVRALISVLREMKDCS